MPHLGRALQGPLQTLTLDGMRDLPRVVLQLPTSSPLTALYIRSVQPLAHNSCLLSTTAIIATPVAAEAHVGNLPPSVAQTPFQATSAQGLCLQAAADP